MTKKTEAKEVKEVVNGVDKTTTKKVVNKSSEKPNKIGNIRKFEGVDYKLESTGIVTEFKKTYRWSYWMSIKDFDGPTGKAPKTLDVRCEITNQPDIDVTTIAENCFLGKK